MIRKIPLLFILALALWMRIGGVYRGLDTRYAFHPDEAKQVVALDRYLHGEYVWYANSRMVDGYPLFLGHLDEWIIRGIRAPQRWIHDRVRPDHPFPRFPDKHELYFWSRTLRVLYGFLAVLITLMAARAMGFSYGATCAAGLLLALSPIASAVTHFSTGEAGTDLFSAAAVWLLALHARDGHARWLFASGLAVGWSFASKYNGVLIAFVTILYLVGRWLDRRDNPRRFAVEGLLSLSGFVAAALIAAPQWIWASERTAHDLGRHFAFVKNYGVPEAVKAWPAWKLAVESFRVNTVPMLHYMGWGMVLLALLALGGAVRERLRAGEVKRDEDATTRRRWLRAAVFAFPVLAFVLSVGGKYRFQPIHFSFLQFAIALAAAAGLSALWAAPRRFARVAAIALFAGSVGELGLAAARESFFWQRDDLLFGVEEIARVYREDAPTHAYRRGAVTPRTIRAYFLEAGNPANFRNRPFTVSGPDGEWWNAQHLAPVPTVPYLEAFSWIFTDGPVFPRNDRLFRVAAGETSSRHVVRYDSPGGVTIGLRSGRFPVRVEVAYGEERRSLEVEPHAQMELVLEPKRWKTLPNARETKNPVYLVPLEVRPVTGDVWVEVLTDAREIRNFRAFGGDAAALKEVAAHLPDRSDTLAALAKTRFVESEPDAAVVLVSKNARVALDGLPALPAGRYCLELDVEAYADGAVLMPELIDRDGRTPCAGETVRELTAQPGLQRLEWRFAKGFAPYNPEFRVSLKSGACRIWRWRVTPDVAAMLDDLEAVDAGGPLPDWAVRFVHPAARPGPCLPVNARFGAGGGIRVNAVSLPDALIPGKPFTASACVETCGESRWEEQQILVRLVTEKGRSVLTFPLNVSRAAVGSAPPVPKQVTAAADLAPGEYAVWVGMLNDRTHLALPLHSHDKAVEASGDWVRAGTIRISAP